ncbi:hypothetical protein HZ993_19720 [Rhodoferax sp. AJA081-3]|uniref:hypothetical protein n=1 Tax=Rhodoferax sp. AJA081-3 TaxID=2752316 RepID=UPI001AE08A73|nr:hypothetical protein [Rhodoferax sp. AJA081-3]QTN27475.1 hypothetical protein HZ993_19720 [Rhodoferax sp. AJA081-3]
MHVIIHGPIPLPLRGPADQFIIVNVTTLHADVKHDPACLLGAGDHPGIIHDSYVTYRFARIDTDADVRKNVNSGVWQLCQPCSADLVAKIRHSACRSKLLDKDAKQFLGCV